MDDCLRFQAESSEDPSRSYALLFNPDLEAHASVDELVLHHGDGEEVTIPLVEGRSGLITLGGGPGMISQLGETVSGPLDLACNSAPAWLASSVYVSTPAG